MDHTTGAAFGEVRSFLLDLGGIVHDGDRSPDTVLAVKNRLARLIEARPSLPPGVTESHGDGYARHLLYGDPHDRFEVIVMAWGPGQSTPIHDHAGIWCVEGVFHGVIDVTRYDLTSLEGETARLAPSEVIHAGLGQCGALIPPVEYHRIANPAREVAVSIHVYGGRMHSCRIFRPRDGDTYDVEIKPLDYTTRQHALSVS